MSAHGGIITSEFLENIRSEKVVNPRIQPDSFATSSVAAPKDKRQLEQQIVDSWDRLRERWDAISSRYLKMNLSDSRSKWMIPLFRELGYDPMFNREDIIVDGDQKLRFRLSHKGWNSSVAPMVHMVLPSQDLEEESHEQEDETSRRGRNRSPHDELQTFLNVNRRCKWGIVTNGILLRILREYFHTTTKGYVEFDVENIFRERSFTDFRALYRMAHASRFLLDKEGLCHLEQFYKESVTAGVSVGENLRRNVKKAIEALGNGFLTPDSAKKMTDDEEFCRAYYSELLRVVYRLLFLLFAEQRAMLPTRDSLYAEEYSIARLREMAETRRGKDEHHDLWEGLKTSFQMLKNGCSSLKVFGYNGSLFDDSEIRILSGLACKNEDVLAAIHHLTLVEEEKVLKRINYLDLGVEEIGSIYESLLDFSPTVFGREQEVEGEKVPSGTFFLDPRGAGRKTTGSYYTHTRLIDELIKSALKPVVEEKLANASDKEKALLSIKVCDPACGSGAFLIAASNYLARELARLRVDQPEPPDKDVKSATRDVLQHCIYGVDLNPMAVELTKVSLWINSCVENMPLNFLDHHIKCGNSLVGAEPSLLEKGLPDEAFLPAQTDNKDFARRLRNQNVLEKKQKVIDEFRFSVSRVKQSKEYASLGDVAEKSTGDVEDKKKKYLSLVSSPEWKSQKFFADAWTAAFYWPLNEDAPHPPTEAVLRIIQNDGGHTIDPKTCAMVADIANQHRFFHWFLEFPDVFEADQGGFDCFLGNPPWERIKLQEKEFFEARNSQIAVEASAVTRKELIKALSRTQPELWRQFLDALRSSEGESKFIRLSGRFPLTAKGDINTYAIFAEHSRNTIGRRGLAGIIVPTGIATDGTNKDFFSTIVDNDQLVSLFDFENKQGLFSTVHRSFKFSLITLGKLRRTATSAFAFFLHNPDQLREEQRFFQLTREDFSLLNPSTKTCPIFRTRRDAELAKGIYKRVATLCCPPSTKEGQSWSIRQTTMFHSMNHAHLLHTKQKMEEIGYTLAGNVFADHQKRFLPLYEGKMFMQYDHRSANVVYTDNIKRPAQPVEVSLGEHMNPSFVPIPREWVDESEVRAWHMNMNHDRRWMLAYKKITASTNERTFIATVLPDAAFIDTVHLLVLDKRHNARDAACLLGNVNSMVFDYLVRQKLGGTTFSFYIFDQMPILSPETYRGEVGELIGSRVLELSYTCHDLSSFACDFGYNGPPFRWNEESRIKLRCELDAIYFLLYGVSKEDADYIMETFTITRNRDIEKYGEYRYKKRVLENYESLREKIPDVSRKVC